MIVSVNEILRAIKCRTGMSDVYEFFYKKKDIPHGCFEIFFEIYGKEGSVAGTIFYNAYENELTSKIDYHSGSLEFDRNVNDWDRVLL